MADLHLGARVPDIEALLFKWWCEQNGQTVSDRLRFAIEDDVKAARHRLMDLGDSYFDGNDYASRLRDLVLESNK